MWGLCVCVCVQLSNAINHTRATVASLQELRGRLVKADCVSKVSLYGATNAAFIEEEGSPKSDESAAGAAAATVHADIVQEKPEDERENWDSKLTFLLATIG